ncbi:MAG: NapC/NirT family cytochrome c [Planctomycetota bacterium]|jgi:hypothetical protein
MVEHIKAKFISSANVLRQTNRRKSIFLGLIVWVAFAFATILTTVISKLAWTANAVWRMSWRKKILFGLAALGIFGFTMIEVTGQPGFCKSCHIMDPFYETWKASSHHEVNCMECHFEPGFVGYVKGKSVAPVHMANYFLGRPATKPNAMVKDASCLRSHCHSSEDLAPGNVDFGPVKFPHDKHVGEVVDGMKISCGMCHNRIEGNEHFKTDRGVCFTCHFLRRDGSANNLVQTGCQGCHEIPETMESESMTIDHGEYVLYDASCEKACHKREFQKLSDVKEGVCLNCHDFGKSHRPDCTELHEIHTNCEKVECFECHGHISHGQEESALASTRMMCEKCHSETHNVQVGIYTANRDLQDREDRRVVSPMFLTHVECTGCHIEQSRPFSGDAYSFGKVARAVPRACDVCHKPGTGDKYIPYWQAEIKKLYDRVNAKLERLADFAQSKVEEEGAQKLESDVIEARAILDSVKADGSWGIHNVKYTEAMLLKAERIIMDAK